VNQYVLDAGIVLGQPLSNLHASIVISAGNASAGWQPSERAHPNIFIAVKKEGRSCHDREIIIESDAMEMRPLCTSTIVWHTLVVPRPKEPALPNKGYCRVSKVTIEWSKNKAESMEVVPSASLEGAGAVDEWLRCAGAVLRPDFDLPFFILT